jgi:oxalate decarboxylase/phosphoglucose isomerase-like protein (cupin superfamily)
MRVIVTGDVVIAPVGCIHDVFNDGNEPLVFISVVSSGDAEYQPITLELAATLYP